jgi:biopolymer transport protein ExbB/TolQ
MEQQLVFVLGALSGLVATMLVYTFVGVLRISQKLKNISRKLDDFERRVWDSDREHRDYINRETETLRNSIDHLYRELFQRIETVERETDQRINDDKENFDRKINDAFRYTDSRIDSAIDHLNKRLGPKGAKEPTLINS